MLRVPPGALDVAEDQGVGPDMLERDLAAGFLPPAQYPGAVVLLVVQVDHPRLARLGVALGDLGALPRSAASSPCGARLLALLAAGLFCCGLYCLAEARHCDLTPGP